MKLASKIVLLCLAAMSLLSGLFCYITIKRDAAFFAQEHVRDAVALGETLGPLFSDAWNDGGHDGLAAFVESHFVSMSRSYVRYVRIDADATPEMQPSAPIDQLSSGNGSEPYTVTTVDRGGVHNMYTYVPLQVTEAGRLEVTRAMTPEDALAQDTLWKSLFLLLAVAAACTGIVVFSGIHMIGRPLSTLVEKAKRIGAGDLSGRIELKGRTELNQLAEAMNEMCDKLELQRKALQAETASRLSAENQLRHVDRLNTVGRLAAGIAHEMGTPLNVISGRAGLIASGKLSPEEVDRSSKTIQAEADRITKIIRGLLNFARRSEPQHEPTDPKTVVEPTVNLLRSLAEKQNIAISMQSNCDAVLVDVDVGQIQQVLTNLIMNAAQAMPSGGEIDITLSTVQTGPPADVLAASGTYLRIDVKDSGCGISVENRKHIFEPFFTTKDVGQGTGLGLAISYGILRDHDGWIDVTSEPDQGACFSVFLPIVNEAGG